VDPGIGFGKTVQHNLRLLNGLSLFHGLGCPIMLGASRKRMIGALSGEAPADQRLAGSIALALKGIEQGVQLLRVHDVPETVQAVRVWRGPARRRPDAARLRNRRSKKEAPAGDRPGRGGARRPPLIGDPL
jgi:dihydropteroate synthase